MFNRNSVVAATFLTLSMALPVSADAQQTDTTTFNVLIEITEACAFDGIEASDVDFGTFVRNEATDVNAQAR